MCLVALGSVAILSAGCSGGSTTASGGTPRPSTTTSTANPSTTFTTTGSTAKLCELVGKAQTVVHTSTTLPMGDGQELLAEAEGSGDHTLTTEALALAAASHVLDAPGVAHALQQMADTCHSYGH